jgi:stringent starvation protein B
MTHVSTTEVPGSSQRPYLIRALHEWCTDNGFTPYLAVHVDQNVQVPLEYVKNNEIVLNIGFEVTSGLKLGNEVIEFKARFGGISRDILIPIDHVVAIYARENGSGMAFPLPMQAEGADTPATPAASSDAPAPPRGLRLAPTATSGPAPAPAPSVPVAVEISPSAVPSGSEGDDDAEPPRPPSGAPRPALKRIK